MGSLKVNPDFPYLLKLVMDWKRWFSQLEKSNIKVYFSQSIKAASIVFFISKRIPNSVLNFQTFAAKYSLSKYSQL